MTTKKAPISTKERRRRSRIRLARLGKKHSKATIAKIKAAMQERAELVRLGVLPHFKHSAKTKRKMRLKAKNRKPSKAARVASIRTRSSNAAEKRFRKLVEKGKFDI